MTSALVVRDMLEAKDAGLLTAFLSLGARPDSAGRHDESAALSMLKPWLADTSVWARAQLLAYIADGCMRPGHRRFVRGLVQHAEAGDDELLGRLAAAFDQSVPTAIVIRTRWDWQAREQIRRRVRRMVAGVPFRARRPEWRWGDDGRRRTGKFTDIYTGGRFSVVTRRYLLRRVVRALRRLAAHPQRYLRAAEALLVATPAARIADPAGLLDARALLTVLYRHADALTFKPHRVDVASGRRVADLSFAPSFPDAWAEHGTDALLRVVVAAPAALARRFAAQQLQRILPELPIAALRPLFRSPHDEARAAALVLLSCARIEGVSAEQWIELLDVDDPALAAELADRAARVLASAELPPATLVGLCRARAAPVALLAARLVVERLPVLGVSAALPALDAEVPAARTTLLAALEPLIASQNEPRSVRELLDSAHADVRACGARLLQGVPSFVDEPMLWTALVESPFADLRGVLLAHLEVRRDALDADRLRAVCAAALLDCMRGSRQRARALALLADAVVEAVTERPDEARRALPLFSIALSSVRAADRRAAVAVLARAAWHQPAVRALIEALPHVALPPMAAEPVEVQA